jgi:cell division septum initiation protein DivIVA
MTEAIKITPQTKEQIDNIKSIIKSYLVEQEDLKSQIKSLNEDIKAEVNASLVPLLGKDGAETIVKSLKHEVAKNKKYKDVLIEQIDLLNFIGD